MKTVLKSLESLAQGSPADILFEAALALNAASIKEVVTKSRLESSNAQSALDELIQNGQLIVLEEGEANNCKRSACDCPAPLE